MIALYCPDIPPVKGGVSDHTLALATALAGAGARPVVLARYGDPALFGSIPCVTGLRPQDVAAAARSYGLRALVVQYVPFLFARRGVSPALFVGISRIHAAGLRLAVVVHEAFVPFTRIPWLITGVPQRIQFGWLVRRAARVYAPLPRYADIARRYAGADTSVAVAPIGATIPPSPLTRAEARARLGLADGVTAIGIFSPAASGFAHEWIAAAVLRLNGRADIRWVRFGFGSERDLPGYPTGANVIQVGESDAVSIAATARALDIAAAPYTDGLTMRRSGAMLALEHGVATVSSEGHLFDPSLRALADCEKNPAAFAERIAQLVDDRAARAAVAAKAGGYGEQASVEALARMMVRDL